MNKIYEYRTTLISVAVIGKIMVNAQTIKKVSNDP
jgi:hypothetical protein